MKKKCEIDYEVGKEERNPSWDDMTQSAVASYLI